MAAWVALRPGVRRWAIQRTNSERSEDVVEEAPCGDTSAMPHEGGGVDLSCRFCVTRRVIPCVATAEWLEEGLKAGPPAIGSGPLDLGWPQSSPVAQQQVDARRRTGRIGQRRVRVSDSSLCHVSIGGEPVSIVGEPVRYQLRRHGRHNYAESGRSLDSKSRRASVAF